MGTGGTVAGAGRFLKEKNPGVRVVAVEPRESPVLRGGKAGAHGIAGIGAGFVPSILDVRAVCAMCDRSCTRSYLFKHVPCPGLHVEHHRWSHDACRWT